MYLQVQNDCKKAFRGARGFTLIELLVVVAIITLLSSSILATINSSREKARMAAARAFEAQLVQSTSDRLLGQWLFDDVNNPWADSSGQGHPSTPVTLSASPTPGANGGMANAFNSTGYLTMGYGTDYMPLPTFTACAWVKSTGLGPGMSINGIFALTYDLGMWIDGSGQFTTRLNSSGTCVYLSVPGNLYDNKFHDVCMSFDGQHRNMYVDGALKGSDTILWSGTSTYAATSKAAIGVEDNNTSTYLFNGVIDDVRLFGGALTQAQLLYYYALGPNSQPFSMR